MQAASFALRVLVTLVALVALIAMVRASGDALAALPRFDAASAVWWVAAAKLTLIALLPPSLFIAAQWPRLWWLPVLLGLMTLSVFLYAEPEWRAAARRFLGL